MRIKMILAVCASCLFITGQVLAAGESYLLAFKDPVGAKRTYTVMLSNHIETGYKGDNVPPPAAMDVQSTAKALETVLDNTNGGASLSITISERKAGVAPNASANPATGAASATTTAGASAATGTTPTAGANPAAMSSTDWTDYSMTFLRSPLGAISTMTCTSGKLPSDRAPSPLAMIASNVLNADTLALTFPATPVKIGGHWTEKVSVTLGQLQSMPNTAGAAAAPAGNAQYTAITTEVTKRYTLQGTQVQNGKTYLVITCDFDTGRKTMQQSMPDTGGNVTQVSLHTRVKEKSTYLFDLQAGEIYCVTTDGSEQIKADTTQNQKTTTFTMTKTGSCSISRVPNA